MSMPEFPANCLDITHEQAFNMLLGSIAMEELALSHILNSEGEKLQYIIGTLPGKPPTCATPESVLKVNNSISDLLDKVAFNQILLKGKLRQVLEAKEKWNPPPEEAQCTCGSPLSCKRQKFSGVHFAAKRHSRWKCRAALSWEPIEGNDPCCCQGCTPSQIYLCPETSYIASFNFVLRAAECGNVCVRLQAMPQRGGPPLDILTCEGHTDSEHNAAHLSGCTVLSPSTFSCASPVIQFVLNAPCAVTVERASLTLSPI